MNDDESLKHTQWECKDHLGFIPKGRRKVLDRGLRKHLGEIFRELAKQKEGRVEEGPLRGDPVHMLRSIPPKGSVFQAMGFLKGKSAIHIARTDARPRSDFVGQNFWARGSWVSTVGKNEALVRQTIQQQEKEDQRLDQLQMFEHSSPPLGGSEIKLL